MQTGAAYIRVSTEDQIEYSPDSQLKKIKEYAAAHGIFIPEEHIYLDEGISGRHAETRPAFMRMIRAAKAAPSPFTVILVWKFSRFARNRQDSILYKSMLRKDCGVEVLSVTEQLADDPTAILIEALLEAMDEYYSINLAQEVRRGMQEKFVRGGVVSQPPFGYRMEDGRFASDPEKAPVVPIIFDSFLRGVPCRQIAEQLNRSGIRTTRGNPFDTRAIRYILQNPVYLGKQRRSAGDGTFLLADGQHEALIGEAVFEAVQRRLSYAKSTPRTRAAPPPREYMLHGLVRCGSCSAALTLSAATHALQCSRYAKGLCSVSHSVSLYKLNQAVLDQLRLDLKDMNFTLTPPQCSADAEKILLQKSIDTEQKRLLRAKESYTAGIDTLEEYRRTKAELLENIHSCEQNLLRLNSTPSALSPFMLPAERLIDLLSSAALQETVKNALLRSFIAKIAFFRPENALQIVYRLPNPE